MLDAATRDFIVQHCDSDVRMLALQAKRYPAVNMHEAVVQIEGWQAAKAKLPSWAATVGIIYPPKISMEQCSSEQTAMFKASLVSGKRFADLTGGFGIDFSYISRKFGKAVYIERNERLCFIARENFTLLGLDHARVVNGNSEEVLATLDDLDWIFIDPARRDGDGRKVVALSECEPNVVVLEELLLQKSTKVMIKSSPMLDITEACRQLKHVETVYIVAVNNECKELLFILGNDIVESCPVHCVNLLKDGCQEFSFTAGEESAAVLSYCTAVGKYLYEPNVAVQKSGCSGILSCRYGIKKLHPNSQLYTSDEHVSSFPGRIFEVVEVLGFSKAEIKKVQALQKANITVRNFPESVQMLRKRLKLSDGGDNYIFATTLAGGEKVLVLCKKVC